MCKKASLENGEAAKSMDTFTRRGLRRGSVGFGRASRFGSMRLLSVNLNIFGSESWAESSWEIFRKGVAERECGPDGGFLGRFEEFLGAEKGSRKKGKKKHPRGWRAPELPVMLWFRDEAKQLYSSFSLQQELGGNIAWSKFDQIHYEGGHVPLRHCERTRTIFLPPSCKHYLVKLRAMKHFACRLPTGMTPSLDSLRVPL